MAPKTTPQPSGAQRFYYMVILLPMWRNQLEQLGNSERQYREHLLAVECLRVAKGPGGDPLRLAEFCKNWQIPTTLPVIGPVSLLRKVGKLVGGWPSQAAIFDPTNSISLGIKVMAQMVPLIAKIQMRNAILVALDESVVGKGDQSAVLAILDASNTPKELMTRVQDAKDKVERVFRETVAMAEKVEAIRKELSLPETL